MVAETMSGRLEVLVRLLGVVLFVQLASEGSVVVDALQAREGTPSSLGLHRPAAPGPSTGLTRDATVARYYAPIYGRVSLCLSVTCRERSTKRVQRLKNAERKLERRKKINTYSTRGHLKSLRSLIRNYRKAVNTGKSPTSNILMCNNVSFKRYLF